MVTHWDKRPGFWFGWRACRTCAGQTPSPPLYVQKGWGGGLYLVSRVGWLHMSKHSTRSKVEHRYNIGGESSKTQMSVQSKHAKESLCLPFIPFMSLRGPDLSLAPNDSPILCHIRTNTHPAAWVCVTSGNRHVLSYALGVSFGPFSPLPHMVGWR